MQTYEMIYHAVYCYYSYIKYHAIYKISNMIACEGKITKERNQGKTEIAMHG